MSSVLVCWVGDQLHLPLSTINYINRYQLSTVLTANRALISCTTATLISQCIQSRNLHVYTLLMATVLCRQCIGIISSETFLRKHLAIVHFWNAYSHRVQRPLEFKNPWASHLTPSVLTWPPFQKGVQRFDNKTTQCKENYIAVRGENSVTRSQRISETGGNTRRHNVVY